MNIFSRDYEEIGSSDKGLILKNSGKVKIQWGRKFIDLLDSNGNLNANVQSLIKKIPSKNSMKDDGFYYCDGILYAKVGNNILELTFESGNTYVSFMVEQEATSEQKYTALKNIGFIYENQSEYNIYPTNGIIYIEDSQTLFIVKDGVLSKYTASIPNPFTEQLVIQKNVENEQEGALVIIGEGVKNGLIFDALQIYMKGKVPIFETDKEFQFLVGNKKVLTINLQGLETEGIKSPEADETKGYRIYEEDGKYILDIDRINVREGLDAGNNIGVMDYEDQIIAPASDFDYLKFSNPRWSDSDYDDIAISLSLYNRIVTIGYNLGKHLEKRLDDIEKRLDDLEDLVGSKPSSINIDYCPSSISVGDTYALSYTLGPSGSEDYEYVRVIWDSEDSDIISIYSQSGVIYGEAVGTTTITATLYVDGNERATATCEIEVAIIPVTSILGIPSYLSIYENDSETLTAYVDPSNASNQQISWEVDPPSGVVNLNSSSTLSGNSVTLEAIGNINASCVVTAKAQDTSNSASASCTVTIIEQPQLPDPYITIDGYNEPIGIGEERELRMIYHDSYGNTQDVTWANGWDLSECGTFLELKTGTLGTFRGIGNGGNGYLSASYQSLSDRIPVAVNSPSSSLHHLSISGYTTGIDIGQYVILTVTAHYYTNGVETSTSDVTNNVNWDYDDTKLERDGNKFTGINNTPSTTVTASYGGKSVSQTVVVNQTISLQGITLSQNILNLQGGSSYNLSDITVYAVYSNGDTNTVTNSPYLTWSTQSNAVSISGHTITAGNSTVTGITITASYTENNRTVTVDLTVNVTVDTYDITLSRYSQTLQEGTSFRLEAYPTKNGVTQNNVVTWTSHNVQLYSDQNCTTLLGNNDHPNAVYVKASTYYQEEGTVIARYYYNNNQASVSKTCTITIQQTAINFTVQIRQNSENGTNVSGDTFYTDGTMGTLPVLYAVALNDNQEILTGGTYQWTSDDTSIISISHSNRQFPTLNCGSSYGIAEITVEVTYNGTTKSQHVFINYTN